MPKHIFSDLIKARLLKRYEDNKIKTLRDEKPIFSEILINIILLVLTLLVSTGFSLLSDRILFQIPQQILNLIITAFSSATILGLLVTSVFLYRKHHSEQERIAIIKVKQNHGDFFEIVQHDSMVLLKGKSK